MSIENPRTGSPSVCTTARGGQLDITERRLTRTVVMLAAARDIDWFGEAWSPRGVLLPVNSEHDMRRWLAVERGKCDE